MTLVGESTVLPRHSCWNFCGKYGIDSIVVSGSWMVPSDVTDNARVARIAVVTTVIPRLKKADMNGTDHTDASSTMTTDMSTCEHRQERLHQHQRRPLLALSFSFSFSLSLSLSLSLLCALSLSPSAYVSMNLKVPAVTALISS